MRVGVLALQGAFIEHIDKLNSIGVETYEIRQLSDFDKECSGLILPGGESTVMGKLLKELDLLQPIRQAIKEGMPVLGTCAGLILLSRSIGNAQQPGINLMNITTIRNGYGRQLGSFTTEAVFNGHKIPMVFIRAPYIQEVDTGVEILSKVKGNIVAARQDNILVTAFHPELTNNTYVYEYFMDMMLMNTSK